MLVIFILSILICDSPVSSVLQYEITEVHMADTEKYVPYTEPPTEQIWVSLVEDAKNLGLLFAGKAEFSWVVDLRVHREDQESWSTGNLLNFQWVLTTCRAQKLLEETWEHASLTTKRLTGGAVVSFFQLYFWEFVENDNWHDYQDKWSFGGSRHIDSYVAYPSCDVQNMLYDAALLKLRVGIAPASPFIGYMPFLKDKNDGNGKRFADYDLSRIDFWKAMCFVGSVGRNYVNWRYHLVLDFKVRFRAYYEAFDNCTMLKHRLCDKKRQNCETAFANRHVEGRGWTCMRTRAKVGTVCDHDRGAPVVCNDEVIGFVAYGALLPYCNNRIPMPFIVIKLAAFSQWTRGVISEPMDDLWARYK